MDTTSQIVYRSTDVTKLLDPFIDLGNLLLADNDPFPSDDGAPNRIPSEEEMLERVRDNTQYLFNKIWALERERVDEAICAKLPRPVLRLPREKVLPEKRQLTKWEQYAQTKGIRKKKKDAKVYDATAKDWKPRYGYRRAQTDKDWLIEIPDHKDPMVDYFGERDSAKKERVHKNELQRLRNVGRSMKNRDIDTGDRAAIGVAKDLEARTKHELVNQIARARQSTASMGKFQPALKNEKTPKKTGKTHQFAANETGVETERKKHLEILERLSSKKPVVNETRLAASQQQSKEPNKKDASKRNAGRGAHRHKSAVHRQQHFEKKLKTHRRGDPKIGRGAKSGNRRR